MPYWVCLYVLERQQENVLVYGYATNIETKSTEWKKSKLLTEKKRDTWNLVRYSCFMGDNELDEWKNSLLNPSFDLYANKSKVTISLGPETLVYRPPVYARGRDYDTTSSPKSLSDQLAAVEAYWQLDKWSLLQRMFPNTTDLGQVRRSLYNILEYLQAKLGIRFLEEEADRLGNFEIIRYVLGNYEVSDGLHIFVKSGKHPVTQEKYTKSVVIWLLPPLSKENQLIVNCKLFNGATTNTVILDQIKTWPSLGLDEGLPFTANEPITSAEVSIWRPCDGILLAKKRITLIRSISVDMSIIASERRLVGPWVNSLPRHLRDRASKLEPPHRTTIVSGHYKHDPWVRASFQSAEIRQALFSRKEEGGFFSNSSLSQVKSMEFLLRLMNRPGVSRIVIADPFFGLSAVEAILARIAHGRAIVVLTSYQKGRNPDTQDNDREQDGRKVLKGFCEANAGLFTNNIEIVSLDNPSEDKQQFHDRYVMIEMGGQQREVWMLSNSLNSAARRFPLVVTRLSDGLAIEVSDYIDDMYKGQIEGRNNLTRNTIWSRTTNSMPNLSLEQKGPLGIRVFDGWQNILDMLVPDGGNVEQQLILAIKRGLMESLKDGHEITWRVPDTQLPQISDAVAKHLEQARLNNVDIAPLLLALAQWAYHGGPSATDYKFGPETLRSIEENLPLALERETNSRETQSFIPLLTDMSLFEALEPALRLIEYPDTWLNTAMRKPESAFYASTLWDNDPAIVVRILDESKDWVTLTLLLHDIFYDAFQSGRFKALLSSALSILKALGIALFWNENERDQRTLTDVSQFLSGSGFLQSDITWILIFLFLRGRPVDLQGADIEDIRSAWTSPITDNMLPLQHIFDRQTGLRAAAQLDSLLPACPIESDATRLGEWIIEKVIEHLPLKGRMSPRYRPGGKGVEFYQNYDSRCIDVFAHHLWRLHGPEAPTWMSQRVLDKLSIASLREPLLRSTDYFTWDKIADGLLFGVRLAIAVVHLAPARESYSSSMSELKMTILDIVFRKLGNEYWLFKNGLLQDISLHLAALAFDQSGRAANSFSLLEEFVDRDSIPIHWRISVVMNFAPAINTMNERISSWFTDKNVKRALIYAKEGWSECWLGLINQYMVGDCPLQPMIQEWLLNIQSIRKSIHSEYNHSTKLYGPNSLVNAVDLANRYKLTHSEMARALRTTVSRLEAYPMHMDFQPLLRALQTVLQKLEGPSISSIDVANWLRKENPALLSAVPSAGSKPLTPWEAVCNGRLNDVIDLVTAAQEGAGF